MERSRRVDARRRRGSPDASASFARGADRPAHRSAIAAASLTHSASSRLVGVATIALLAWTSPAAADVASDARAASEFQKGQRAFQAEDYRTAARAFEAAYAAKPHHDALFNAGRSWQRAGDEIRAANLLERYLREAPADARDRNLARSVLSETARRAGRIRLEIVDVENPTLDGEPTRTGFYYVAPGDHVILGDAAKGAGRVRKTFTAKAGELSYIVVAPEKGDKSDHGDKAEPKATSAPLEPKTGNPPERGPPPSEPSDATVRASRGLPPVVVVAGGALVAIAGGITIGFGLDAVDKREEFLGDRTAPRLDAVGDAETRTNVMLGTTIGLAAITGVVALLLVDWKGTPTKPTPSTARAIENRLRF